MENLENNPQVAPSPLTKLKTWLKVDSNIVFDDTKTEIDYYRTTVFRREPIKASSGQEKKSPERFPEKG